jgi:hypothetical protein
MHSQGSIDLDIFRGVRIDFQSEFMAFALERQAIFERRAAGQPAPWTDDPTLQRYHFSNILRDDDRVSRFVHKWVRPTITNAVALFGNLAYARMCNKPSTMEATGLLARPDGSWQSSDTMLATFAQLGGPKRAHGRNARPLWVNAYQVPGNFKQKLGIASREELIARHIPKVTREVVEALGTRNDDVGAALERINAVWGYNNDFVFTQVLLDLTSLRPDLVLPTASVPMGSGLQPLVRALDRTYETLVEETMELWNADQSRRLMFPKDAEHALCEFRKYAAWSRGLNKTPKLYRPER